MEPDQSARDCHRQCDWSLDTWCLKTGVRSMVRTRLVLDVFLLRRPYAAADRLLHRDQIYGAAAYGLEVCDD